MKIYLASDHAGFELKEEIKKYLLENNFTIEDMGTHSVESVNWVEYGAKAAGKVSQDPEHSKGVLVCGSGIGMSIVSNKFKHVRAALCHDQYGAEMSRKHNNANVLTMGGRVIEKEDALSILAVWLKTGFEGGRHQTRLDYLRDIVEKNNFK
ncbi:MAG: ribose 5-phosphate isomerase B [Candidatus Aminicenantes bacterium]|jgi:ribose 5-phosphate isomerase B